MVDFFRKYSRSVRDAQNPGVVHQRTAEVIQNANIILYGPGTPESNVIPIGIPLGNQQALAWNTDSVKIFMVNPTKENKRLRSNAVTQLRAFYRALSGQNEVFTNVKWSRVTHYVDYALGRSSQYRGRDPNKEYTDFRPGMIGQETGNRVAGVAIDLESPDSRVRPGVGYQSGSSEYGFFHDSLTKEAVIALHAIKMAGQQLTGGGKRIIKREKAVPPPLVRETHVAHMKMIRRRMESAGIVREDQEALLAEMKDFSIKSQQWFYARLMRRMGFPVQQWLPECQNAEWAEMTSRMVELLNSVTEVISLDYDDTLEKRNTDLSPLNARRLARRIAAGQKIAFNTAKTQEELKTVINAQTGEPGVEIYAPLRQALVSVLQEERSELFHAQAENAADDLLHDMFFLYMNSGGALARPTDRGISRVEVLPLDPYFTVEYPPELQEKIKNILAEVQGPPESQDKTLSQMVMKLFSNRLRLFNVIIQPFGPTTNTT